MTIIKRGRVEVRELTAEERAKAATRGPRATDQCEKQVELVTDRGQVIALELVCSCGERTVVSLEYAEQPPQ